MKKQVFHYMTKRTATLRHGDIITHPTDGLEVTVDGVRPASVPGRWIIDTAFGIIWTRMNTEWKARRFHS